MFSVKELLQATGGTLLQGDCTKSIKGISTDSRTIRRRELFIPLIGDNFDGHRFIATAQRKAASGVMTQKRIPRGLPKDFIVIKVDDTLKALGDIARFHRKRFSIKVIAITGSNGKTTTKDMVASILKKRYNVLKTEGTKNNQIGVPLTLLRLRKHHDVAVLELGTNQQGEIKQLASICLPDSGVITNIGLSHIEFLKNAQGVYREKIDLFKSMRKGSQIVFNYDDPLLKKAKSLFRNRHALHTFGYSDGCDFQVTKVIKNASVISFQMNKRTRIDLKTTAAHNIYNALAAICCARIMKVGYETIYNALRSFTFPAGRFTKAYVNGVTVIDDTYNSNPASLQSAIDALAAYRQGRKVLVCADMLELGRSAKKLHFDIGKRVAVSGIDMLVTVGNLSRLIAEGARTCNSSAMKIYHCCSHKDALDRLSGRLGNNDAILVKGSRSMHMEKVIDALKHNITTFMR
ncbi:UDP-N-acetylmuramoyl-tripeptide--D-alanyl-D-alanine ligase [Candidatus Omnitrophota bacterium]